MVRIRVFSYLTVFFVVLAGMTWLLPWAWEDLTPIPPQTLHYVFGSLATGSAILVARSWGKLTDINSVTHAVVSAAAACFAITLHVWPQALPFFDGEMQAAAADALSKALGAGSLWAGLKAGNEKEPNVLKLILEALLLAKDPAQADPESEP